MNTLETNWLSKYGILRTRLIYNYKPFNRLRLKYFYSQFISKGSLCFDIGAHTGNRTFTWLGLGAKVVALEPHPQLAKFLLKRASRSPGAIILEKAVSDKPGRELFKISSRYPSISTLSDEWTRVMTDFDPSVKWQPEIEVITTTLNDLIQKYGIPGFIKIDVEGYEVKALKGLSYPIRVLSFEFFPTTLKNTMECLTLLDVLGDYRYNWSLTESLRLISTEWLTSMEMRKLIMNYSGRKSGDIYAKLQEDPT
jgi:FkbM family methyltransferase